MFDPNGKISWGIDPKGGFLTGQANVPTRKISSKERKEQQDCKDAVDQLKRDFEDADNLGKMKAIQNEKKIIESDR